MPYSFNTQGGMNAVHVDPFARPNRGKYGLTPKRAPGPRPPAPRQMIDPRDSTYYGNVQNHQFGTNNAINGLTQQNSYGATDLQEALRRMTEGQQRGETGLAQNANQQGLLYSGQIGQQLGLARTQGLRQQGDARNQFARQSAARQSQIGALQGGEPLYAQQQYGAAQGRWGNRILQLAAAGLLPKAASAGPKANVPNHPGKPSNNRPRSVLPRPYSYNTQGGPGAVHVDPFARGGR